jgi:hypothetical protein
MTSLLQVLQGRSLREGAILTLVLVYGSVFIILFGGLFGFIFIQHRQASQKVAWNQALDIAEAGMNYYRWCLNHGVEENCATPPEGKDYYGPEGDLFGKFSLEISSIVSCEQTIQRSIVSTGWTEKYPDIKRKVSVLYARTSIAKHSYILNDNVWVGADHEIRGPYHSNGGVRMDGENQSTVTSAKENWICTSSFGCSPCPTGDGCWIQSSQCYCPGVFTTTDNAKPDLFSYPIPPFDFNAITVDLAQMKTASQTPGGGVYLPPSTDLDPNGKGYHIKFFKDAVTGEGKFEAWIITNLSPTYAYSLEEGWHYDYFTITGEYLYNTYTIPSNCSAIFIEDKIWPEGVVKGKVAVASANLINPNVDTDIVLPANIDYSVKDGADGLTLIGERNILIGPQSPNQMELRGIFVAQKGRFSRNHYPYNLREKLEIYGSIISNGRVGTKWTSGGQVVSGYQKRESYFDANLIYNPPVFTPFLDPDFEILQWEEI